VQQDIGSGDAVVMYIQLILQGEPTFVNTPGFCIMDEACAMTWCTEVRYDTNEDWLVLGQWKVRWLDAVAVKMGNLSQSLGT
jgi:hypothetical protein